MEFDVKKINFYLVESIVVMLYIKGCSYKSLRSTGRLLH